MMHVSDPIADGRALARASVEVVVSEAAGRAVFESSPAEWQYNQLGTVQVKYGSPQIRNGGSIVLTTGVAGRRPHNGWVIAASVCGTIEALTRAPAIELAPIRVNAVSPGLVRTNLWHNMSAAEREQLYESVGKHLPVRRVGKAHDIAQAYLFLMKEGFGTGQTVVVDGGTILV